MSIRRYTPMIWKVLTVGALAAVVFAGCDLFGSVSIDARIASFLDDLEAENYGSQVASHFHSSVTTNVSGSAGQWEYFNPSEASRYTWAKQSESSSNEYGGTTRVPGTLTIDLTTGGTDGPKPLVFYMKVEDGDWMIRAIDDGGDDVFIFNIR